jgi:hypothetical protein
LTPAQVRTIIESTAQDQVGNPIEDLVGYDQYMGHGRANAFAALQSPLVTNVFNTESGQEFTLINPEQKGQLQVFSKGRHTGKYECMIHAIDGKLLHTEMITIKAGVNTMNFFYPNGHYIVALKSDSYSKIFKVVKN